MSLRRLIAFASVSSLAASAAIGDDLPDFQTLMQRWKHRDGAAVAEVGDELSHALIADPRGFCSAFSSEPGEFDEWISGLDVHTFTDYLAETEADREVSTRSHEKLRSQMERAAASLMGEPKCEQLATRLLSALKSIRVRFID